MKLSTADLKSLFEHPDFRTLPTQMVLAEQPDMPWMDTLKEITEAGAKQVVWEIGACVALLFDTYGDLIEEVDLSIERTDTGHLHVYFQIDGYECYYGKYDVDEDKRAELGAIDNLEAFQFTVNRLDDFANHHLVPAFSTLEAASKTFTSSEEARDVARKQAPQVEAWVRKRLLEDHVATQLPSPRPKPRGM